MAKRMTNAMLVDENIRLRAQCDVLERQIAELSAQVAQVLAHARPAKQAAQGSVPNLLSFERSRHGYYAYVNARREACRAAGRPVSYKTWDQFMEAHEEAVYS